MYYHSIGFPSPSNSGTTVSTMRLPLRTSTRSPGVNERQLAGVQMGSLGCTGSLCNLDTPIIRLPCIWRPAAWSLELVLSIALGCTRCSGLGCTDLSVVRLHVGCTDLDRRIRSLFLALLSGIYLLSLFYHPHLWWLKRHKRYLDRCLSSRVLPLPACPSLRMPTL